VPENIHKAEEFLRVLRNLLEFLKGRLRMRQVTSETPSQLLKSLTEATQIDAKTLRHFTEYYSPSFNETNHAFRFCTSRLNSLMKTLQLTEMDKYTSIGIICDFFTMLGTYTDGFVIIMEPYDERNPTVHDPVLQFRYSSCLFLN
jgi:DNA excision repair protein ERCC-2